MIKEMRGLVRRKGQRGEGAVEYHGKINWIFGVGFGKGDGHYVSPSVS